MRVLTYAFPNYGVDKVKLCLGLRSTQRKRSEVCESETPHSMDLGTDFWVVVFSHILLDATKNELLHLGGLFLSIILTGCEVHPSSCEVGTGGSSGRSIEANHWTLCNVWIKYMWISTSMSTYVSMVRFNSGTDFYLVANLFFRMALPTLSGP